MEDASGAPLSHGILHALGDFQFVSTLLTRPDLYDSSPPDLLQQLVTGHQGAFDRLFRATRQPPWANALNTVLQDWGMVVDTKDEPSRS